MADVGGRDLIGPVYRGWVCTCGHGLDGSPTPCHVCAVRASDPRAGARPTFDGGVLQARARSREQDLGVNARRLKHHCGPSSLSVAVGPKRKLSLRSDVPAAPATRGSRGAAAGCGHAYSERPTRGRRWYLAEAQDAGAPSAEAPGADALAA